MILFACPICRKQAAQNMKLVPPSSHLADGQMVCWCRECGTYFETRDAGRQIVNLFVPEVSRKAESS